MSVENPQQTTPTFNDVPQTNEELLSRKGRSEKNPHKKKLTYVDLTLMSKKEGLDESDIKRAFSKPSDIGKCTKIDQKSLGNMRKLPFEDAVHFCRKGGATSHAQGLASVEMDGRRGSN